MKLFLLLALSAPLLSTSVMADQSTIASGMRTRTEPALACLLGFQGPKPVAPSLCLNDLFESRRLGVGSWAGPIGYCAQEYVRERDDNCPHGPLEAVDYLGTNAAGDDVYEVQYMSAEAVYIIPPPGPDGKSGPYWIKMGPLGSIIPSSLVHITSPATDKMNLYRRPWKSTPPQL